MSKKKQHLDDFLRDKLNELPNAPVAGFERVERRMAVKSHRGIVLMLLIPLIFSGIYWLSTFNEGDLVAPQHDSQPINPGNSSITDESSQQASPLLPQEADQEMTEASEPPDISSEDPATLVEADLQAPANTQLASAELVNKQSAANPMRYDSEQLVLRPPPDVDVSSPSTAIVRQREAPASAPVFVVEDMGKTSSSAVDAQMIISGEDLSTPLYANASPWEVTLNFYPNYTFRDFKMNPAYADEVNPRYEEIIKSSEKGGFGFNVGVAVRYALGKDVFIASGLGYIENKVNGRYNFDIYQPIDPVTQDNVARVGKTEEFKMYTAIPVNQGIVQTFRYVQVPLHVSYQPWATKRLRLLVEGGFSYIRFLNASGTTIDYQTLVPRDVADLDYVKNSASFDFKVGFAYYVSNQVAVGLEPSLLYFTNSIFKDDHPTYVVPWSVGVNFNVRMRLY